MYAVLTSLVPADQIVVVHADLLSADWAGLQDHIIANIDHDLVVAKAVSGRRGTKTEKDKDFFDMVEVSHERLGGKSSPWPSPGQRQCTSDLKRTPIEVEVRRMMREGGYTRAVNCMGIRAQESTDRKDMDVVKHNKNFDAPTIDRTVTDFLPIHDLDIEDVWKIIDASGQVRHYAYDLGMSRLSCCFCIYGDDNDLRIAAENNPELYRRYVEMERKTGFTFKMDRKSLEDHTGIRI
jgi:3'-phosphoadenosine 5'-phosphosulfate sulfotransferase (PAPS reductase)/FAD synthetase